MIQFNFPGQCNIQFSLLRDTKKNPYKKNKLGLITNMNSKELGVAGALGGLSGLQAGMLYNDMKNPKTIAGIRPKMKGSWKAKLGGAAIGATATAGTGLLLRKTNKKDKDGRSDKGKRRK